MANTNNNNDFRTPLHDDIHLWMSENIRDVLYHLDYDFEIHKRAKINLELEKSVYNNNYRIGVIDGVIEMHDNMYCTAKQTTKHSYGDNQSFEEIIDWYELEECPNIYQRIIYDIKPHFDSLSGAMGQIKNYAEYLRYYCFGSRGGKNTKPEMFLVTLEDDKFDDMLLDQGIKIFHIFDSRDYKFIEYIRQRERDLKLGKRTSSLPFPHSSKEGVLKSMLGEACWENYEEKQPVKTELVDACKRWIEINCEKAKDYYDKLDSFNIKYRISEIIGRHVSNATLIEAARELGYEYKQLENYAYSNTYIPNTFKLTFKQGSKHHQDFKHNIHTPMEDWFNERRKEKEELLGLRPYPKEDNQHKLEDEELVQLRLDALEEEQERWHHWDGLGIINLGFYKEYEEYKRKRQLRWTKYQEASSEEREEIRIEDCVGLQGRGSKHAEGMGLCSDECECGHVYADHGGNYPHEVGVGGHHGCYVRIESYAGECLYCDICDEPHEDFDYDDISKGVTFGICDSCTCIIENIENNKCECECECERVDKKDITLHKLCDCEEFRSDEYANSERERQGEERMNEDLSRLPLK